MATTTGSSVNAANFNALFDRLNTIRTNHLSRSDVSGPTTAFNKPAVQGNKVTTDEVSQLVDDIESLEKNVSNITGFSSSITIPSVGDLLQASRIAIIETAITGIEAECVNCSFNSSFFTSHRSSFFSSHRSSNFGHNGSFFSSRFSHFTNDGFNNTRCSRFSNNTSFCTSF